MQSSELRGVLQSFLPHLLWHQDVSFPHLLLIWKLCLLRVFVRMKYLKYGTNKITSPHWAARSLMPVLGKSLTVTSSVTSSGPAVTDVSRSQCVTLRHNDGHSREVWGLLKLGAGTRAWAGGARVSANQRPECGGLTNQRPGMGRICEPWTGGERSRESGRQHLSRPPRLTETFHKLKVVFPNFLLF